MKLIPRMGKYSEPCSFLFSSGGSTSRSTSRHEMFICCLSGEAIESDQKAFLSLKIVFFLEIYFSILFCWGFFFFFGLLWAPTSHVRVWEKLGSSWNEHSDKRVTARRWRAVKDIWSRPQTPPAAAALIQALLQGRSQALAPGTATFCSTPVLPVLHFLLQKRRKGSRPESEIYIYIYIRSNQCTLKTSWHLISLEKKSVNCFPTKEFVRDVKEALHRVTASFLRIVFIWYIKCSQVFSLKAAFCSVRCCPDSCNKGLGGKCTKVRSNYWFINTQRVEVQLYKMKRQRDSTNQRLVLESHTETWDSSAIDDVAQNNILSSASALKTSGTNNRFAKCLQNQDEIKVY